MCVHVFFYEKKHILFKKLMVMAIPYTIRFASFEKLEQLMLRSIAKIIYLVQNSDCHRLIRGLCRVFFYFFLD